MIRFCDKEVFTISRGQMSRTELLLFFLDGHRADVIVFVDTQDLYYGMTTYHRLLKYVEEEEYIYHDYTFVSPDFWGEQDAYFKGHPEELLPIMSSNMQLMGFCYDEHRSSSLPTINIAIENLGQVLKDNPCCIQEIFPKIQQFFIMDINQWAFNLYQILKEYNFPVCVVGEKWEWFGIQTMEGYYDYPEFAKFYLYAEGSNFVREYGRSNEVGIDAVSPYWRELWFKVAMPMTARAMYSIEKRIKQAGGTFLHLVFPDSEETIYRTKEEEEGKSCVLNDYVIDSNASEAAKQIFYKIYGEETVEYFRHRGNNSENEKKEFLAFGNLTGEMLQNQKGLHTIYLVGPCIVSGTCVKLEESLISHITKKLAGYFEDYKVVGIPIFREECGKMKMLLENLPVREKDIVIFLTEEASLEDIPDKNSIIDLHKLFNDRSRPSIYTDSAFHTNSIGNQMIAVELFEHGLKDAILRLKEKETDDYLFKGQIINANDQIQINQYIQQIVAKEWDALHNIGSIVMNGNPFTLGHQHLVEYASSQVEGLYLFVVEEDSSEFPFAQRFEMAKRGTAHLSNVHVIPSGQFVLSKNTFYAYFDKVQKQEEIVDASKDVEIFARYIAPPLHIARRFVGEEPFDKVTRQYNEQMTMILEENGIALEVISRLAVDKCIISATTVRQLLKEGNLDALKKFVPGTTLEILYDNK